jgi:hypothetical protein
MDAERMNALEGIVTEVDDENPSAEQQQAQQAEAQQALALQQQAQEWAAIAFMVGGALRIIEPSLERVYTEQACVAWGASVVPVAEKYGWNGPGSVPELGLLIATAGLAVPSYLAIRAKVESLRAAREAQERAKRPAEVPTPVAGAPDGS